MQKIVSFWIITLPAQHRIPGIHIIPSPADMCYIASTPPIALKNKYLAIFWPLYDEKICFLVVYNRYPCSENFWLADMAALSLYCVRA